MRRSRVRLSQAVLPPDQAFSVMEIVLVFQLRGLSAATDVARPIPPLSRGLPVLVILATLGG